MRVILKILIRAQCLNLAILDDAQTIGQMKEVNGVCDKNSSFLLKAALEDFTENSFAHIRI